MKKMLLKQFVTIVLLLLTFVSFSQVSNTILSFELKDNSLFSRDAANNLHCAFIIKNLDESQLTEFITAFTQSTGVLKFNTTENENSEIQADATFEKADINYFYNLFKDNGVSAIEVNGKTTKIQYMEYKTDPLPSSAISKNTLDKLSSPVVFQNASDPNSLDYYDKRIADAEYKILWVQHDKKEINKAIKSGWFENADKTLMQLKTDKEKFIKNYEKK